MSSSENRPKSIGDWYQKRSRRREDIALNKLGRQMRSETIFRVFCEELNIGVGDLRQRRGGGLYRGVIARLLIRYGGLTQREVAEHLGVKTGAAFSIRIKEAEQLLKTSGRWRKSIGRVEKRLDRPLTVTAVNYSLRTRSKAAVEGPANLVTRLNRTPVITRGQRQQSLSGFASPLGGRLMLGG